MVKKRSKTIKNRRGKAMRAPSPRRWDAKVLLPAIGLVLSLAGVALYLFVLQPNKPSSVQQGITTVNESGLIDSVTEQKPQLPPITPGEIKSNIAYCNGQLLDLYQPRNIVYERSPLVIYIHGGGWVANNKASEPGQLARIDGLRDEGFAVASINYRKIPNHYYPAPIEDALCAVRYLRANADKYYLNPDKFATYGFSAGGHLAAMTGVVESQFGNNQYKGVSSKVQAVVTLAAYLDFENGLYDRNPAVLGRFMNGAALQSGSPVNYVSKDDAAFLLIHGLHDKTIPAAQSELFSGALTKEGVKNELLLVENAGHGLEPIAGPIQPSFDEVVQRMHEFIQKELKVRQ